MSTNKPRGDAKLATLPPLAQEQLWQYLRGHTQEATLVWLAETHGVRSSPSALSGFWVWYQRQGWLKQSADFADQLKASIEKLPALAGKAQDISAIAQAAFEIQAAQDRDLGAHLALLKSRTKTAELRLKERNVALSERKVKLLEAKAALADKGKAVASDDGLSEAEQLARFKQIFGAS
jgi:hypothetical protein